MCSVRLKYERDTVCGLVLLSTCQTKRELHIPCPTTITRQCYSLISWILKTNYKYNSIDLLVIVCESMCRKERQTNRPTDRPGEIKTERKWEHYIAFRTYAEIVCCSHSLMIFREFVVVAILCWNLYDAIYIFCLFILGFFRFRWFVISFSRQFFLCGFSLTHFCRFNFFQFYSTTLISFKMKLTTL